MSCMDLASSAHGDSSDGDSPAASPTRQQEVDNNIEDDPEVTVGDSLDPLTQHTSNADSVRDYASVEREEGEMETDNETPFEFSAYKIIFSV